jgi:hypothetical protein
MPHHLPIDTNTAFDDTAALDPSIATETHRRFNAITRPDRKTKNRRNLRNLLIPKNNLLNSLLLFR